MLFSDLLATALLTGSALSIPLVPRELSPYTSDIEVHSSCNATQRRMLQKALSDTYEVASFAKEYITTNGGDDPIFQQYFGTDTGSYTQVIGIWDAFLTSNKQGVLLRCDNPDGNCGQDGWRGHWRGDNATSETVICDLSYTDRLFNENFCMFGHRFFHIPAVTNGKVDHYAEDYTGILELAEHNSTYATVDSNALQYFAARKSLLLFIETHVYALEVAKGGDACIGKVAESSSSKTSSLATSASWTGSSVPDASSSSTPAASSTAAASSDNAGKDCHTHADGAVHCV
ncbi:hypothetical protein B9479_000892 [Cryptococcus floricola]|uniref:Putative peptidase domain-containing protein n=1 Tax=Cryptococcus floricola TaxID=2591691 RepID=A0A5D3B7P0_9TREE|nr:hypothetical protein B9479_000892 [Cryptococcus floricola]